VRIFFSAGEASGDAYGGALLRLLRARLGVDTLFVEAIGGERLRQAGAKLVADSSAWGAIGVAESLRVYPKARLGLARGKKALAAGEPGVFVPIDYGYLNIGLARHAKERGWKVVYFSPPGAWRKDRQGEDLPQVSDAIVTPFSWSAEILNRMGADAHWFGHPIRQMIRDARAANSPNEDKGATIAVLPGSRRSELDLLLPVLAEAVAPLEGQAEVAVAPSLDPDRMRARWLRHAPGRDDLFTQNDTYGVLQRARAAIVCSGTATLEAALCACPHVVVYKVSKLVEAQARLVRFRVRHIAQPNILLERDVVPELIQYDATPKRIQEETRRLLQEESARIKQLQAFRELKALLGPDDALDRTADLIAGFLRPAG
jgi:lipid-A-disaccharide synthase